MEAADDFQSSKCPLGQVRRDCVYWLSPVGMKVEKTVGSRGVGSRTREVGHEIYNFWVLRSCFILSYYVQCTAHHAAKMSFISQMRHDGGKREVTYAIPERKYLPTYTAG
jgi:hypothetical protein